jgi:putative oxidoreductase
MQGLMRYTACCDGVADSLRDTLLLIGRILIAVVFLMTVSGGGPAAGYLKSLNYVAPDAMAMLAHLAEWIIVITLILGFATRIGALIAFAFVVIAVSTAHLYWQYPAQQQPLQWVFLSKDLAITGGILILFVTGGGRYSLDAKLMGK